MLDGQWLVAQHLLSSGEKKKKKSTGELGMDQGWCGRCWNCWVVLRPIRNSNADKINMSAASDLRHTVNKHKLKIQLITKGNGQKWYSMEWDHILEMCNRWQWMACHPLLQALGAASIWEEWSSQSKSFPYHWRWQTLPNIYKKHFPLIQYFFFFFSLKFVSFAPGCAES